jgi:hypothetical protein
VSWRLANRSQDAGCAGKRHEQEWHVLVHKAAHSCCGSHVVIASATVMLMKNSNINIFLEAP